MCSSAQILEESGLLLFERLAVCSLGKAWRIRIKQMPRGSRLRPEMRSRLIVRWYVERTRLYRNKFGELAVLCKKRRTTGRTKMPDPNSAAIGFAAVSRGFALVNIQRLGWNHENVGRSPAAYVLTVTAMTGCRTDSFSIDLEPDGTAQTPAFFIDVVHWGSSIVSDQLNLS